MSDTTLWRQKRIGELEQQLATALAAIKVKDAVLGDIAECIGAGRLRVASAEAIAATADLDGLILCAAKPVACYQGHDKASGWETITLLENIPEGTNLYRTGSPK